MTQANDNVPAGLADAAPVSIPERSFPESLTSTCDGTLYVGSLNLGGVVRVVPGGKAEPFIQPSAAGSRSVLGVLADENGGTLYVCSNDMTGLGIPGPSDTKGAWLKTFDLASGAPKGSFPLADPKSMSNDIAVGYDGDLYVTQFIPGALFRIAVSDGKAGAVTVLKPSRALDRPDGMRAYGDGFLLIEGAGRLNKVTVKGDRAEIETIQDGFVEPVGVTVVGNTAWIAEGKSSFLFGANKGKDPGPFTIKPVALLK